MRYLSIIAAFAIATPALAQNTTTNADDPGMTTSVPVQDDDNDFPWGLLGLIGLAGLLGRKKDNHVHNDARRA